MPSRSRSDADPWRDCGSASGIRTSRRRSAFPMRRRPIRASSASSRAATRTSRRSASSWRGVARGGALRARLSHDGERVTLLGAGSLRTSGFTIRDAEGRVDHAAHAE